MSQNTQALWKAVFEALMARRVLDEESVRWVATEIVEGAATDAHIAIFVALMQAKGIDPGELSAFADATFLHSFKLQVDRQCIDIVGTGGDGTGAVNISTMAAVLVAASGFPVVKHGGRAASSPTGSADVVEALGLPLTPSHEELQECLREVGLIFCFAPNFHPGLRHAAPARRSFGLPTIFNAMAPLLNPAQPKYGVIGCADLSLAPTLAQVASRGGSHALVVRGRDGLDKATMTGPSDVWRVSSHQLERLTVNPREFGFTEVSIGALRGSTAQGNAELVERVLSGEQPGAIADVVILNAALALASTYPAPAPEPFHDRVARAITLARETMTSGAARDKLDNWRKFHARASQS